MREFRSAQDAEYVASVRQRKSATGVGAAVYADVSAPSLDGLQLRLTVTDGISAYESVDVVIASVTEAQSGEVEDRVERLAGRYSSLAELVAASPLRWSGFDSD